MRVALRVMAAIAALSMLSCAMPQPPAAAPTPSPSPQAVATRSPTLAPAQSTPANAAATRKGPAADTPRALVDAFVKGWERRSASGVADLFTDKIEYQMGPNYINDNLALRWYTYYWMATNGEMRLTSCDPEIGDTIRCDFVYESDCERLIDGEPFHFNMRFAIRGGKIEKALSTMGPGELQKLSARFPAVLEWAEANMPEEYARHYELTTNDFNHPDEAGAVIAKICAAYGAAHRPTPTSTP